MLLTPMDTTLLSRPHCWTALIWCPRFRAQSLPHTLWKSYTHLKACWDSDSNKIELINFVFQLFDRRRSIECCEDGSWGGTRQRRNEKVLRERFQWCPCYTWLQYAFIWRPWSGDALRSKSRWGKYTSFFEVLCCLGPWWILNFSWLLRLPVCHWLRRYNRKNFTFQSSSPLLLDPKFHSLSSLPVSRLIPEAEQFILFPSARPAIFLMTLASLLSHLGSPECWVFSWSIKACSDLFR